LRTDREHTIDKTHFSWMIPVSDRIDLTIELTSEVLLPDNFSSLRIDDSICYWVNLRLIDLEQANISVVLT